MVRSTVVPVMCHQRLLRTVCWTEILHQISSIHWRRRSIRRLRVSIRSVGDAFDPNAYFDSADKEGELTVQSNVNTAKAGS